MIEAMPVLALFPNIGFPELLLIAAVGVLIFGRRLPEVGRSVAKGIVEFKRGLREVELDVETASRQEEEGKGSTPAECAGSGAEPALRMPPPTSPGSGE